jgi:hypothetical protein
MRLGMRWWPTSSVTPARVIEGVSVMSSRRESTSERVGTPATLYEAQEVLWRQRPARDANPLAWVRFHRLCAKVYARTSEVDTRHKHEALAYAGMEIRKARDIEHRLNPEVDDG